MKITNLNLQKLILEEIVSILREEGEESQRQGAASPEPMRKPSRPLEPSTKAELDAFWARKDINEEMLLMLAWATSSDLKSHDV